MTINRKSQKIAEAGLQPPNTNEAIRGYQPNKNPIATILIPPSGGTNVQKPEQITPKPTNTDANNTSSDKE